MAKNSIKLEDVIFQPLPKNPRFVDLTGKRFGRLTVLGFAGKSIDKSKTPMFWCQCKSGNVVKVHSTALKSGHTRSCGCLHRETVRSHGMSNSPERTAYENAKARCRPNNGRKSKDHGDRGIEFRFENFEDFFSEIGFRPSSKYSVDRIDVDGHYEPGNIRWATNLQQSRNRSDNVWIEINGIKKVRLDWCKKLGLKYTTAQGRMNRGWCGPCSVSVKSGEKRTCNCS